jgi:hypothetical protein
MMYDLSALAEDAYDLVRLRQIVYIENEYWKLKLYLITIGIFILVLSVRVTAVQCRRRARNIIERAFELMMVAIVRKIRPLGHLPAR